MSDKLMLSAVLSVLMMTAYVLLGGEAARAPSGFAIAERPAYAAELRAPSLGVVLARVRTRHILY